MFGNYITIPHILIFLPLLAGLISFFMKNGPAAKNWALFVSIITLCFSFSSIYYRNNAELNGLTYNYEWLKYIGASFSVSLDGVGRLLTLLTAISFPLIFFATYNNNYEKPNAFYGLMLLSQAGLMGVFVSTDVLLFYFFWELALIPVYFLCSFWGGEKRIQATFKFFIYTFAGSLLMLVGIIYTYLHTSNTQYADHSFSVQAFHSVLLMPSQQNWMFWLFFIAFAIKMPIFPFHTWQPSTYEQSPTAVTMVLSGVMVKMGLFGIIRWVLPMFPAAVNKFDNVVIILSITGIVYASLIAIKQDDIKRLVAYSSIAHIGLMCASLFTGKQMAIEGVMIQMFNHGINIIGLWIVVFLIEKQLGVRKISQLGGIAHKAPVLTIMLVVIALANIALPLTNAFIGEFMMFAGLYQYGFYFALVAGTGIILAAIYTLNMIKHVFYGETNELTANMKDISFNEKAMLSVVVVMIFMGGLFPQPMLDIARDTVSNVMTRFK